MAFETKRHYGGSPQQARIGGSVRAVAGLASIDSQCRMFEGERSPLVGVAADARLFSVVTRRGQAGPGSHAPRGRRSSVGIMTIGARHEALVDPVLEGHRELRLDRVVAAVAEIALCLGEQEFGRLRLVNRVAGRAHHFVFSVNRTPDLAARQILGVTLETCVELTPCIHQREGSGNGPRPAAGLDMPLRGSMASLAAGTLRRLLARGDALVVRILVEIQPHVRVTRFTDVAPDESVRRSRGGRGWRRASGGEDGEGKDGKPYQSAHPSNIGESSR